MDIAETKSQSARMRATRAKSVQLKPKRLRITRCGTSVNMRFRGAISSRLFSFFFASLGGETITKIRGPKTNQEK
jgi:hypothetical protein